VVVTEATPVVLRVGQGSGLATDQTGSALQIDPSGLDSFRIEADGGGNIGAQAAGVPFDIDVTALDAYGNTVTSFSGNIDITDTTGSIAPVAAGPFTAGFLDVNGVTITTADSNVDITVQNSAGVETGVSNSFTVNPGAATQYVFIGSIPDPLQAGETVSVTVQARDAFGNVDATYNASARFSDIGADGLAFLTSESGYANADITFAAGVWSGNIRTDTSIVNNINTIGNTAQLQLDELPGPGPSGTTNAFDVEHGPLHHFEFVTQPPANVDTNTPFNVVVHARDQYNNYVDYAGAGIATVSDLTGTVYEDPTPGDDQIDFTSVNVGGYAVGEADVWLVVTAARSNNRVYVTDNVGGSVTGASSLFNVIANQVQVEKTADLAPRVALAGETIDIFDIRLTNVITDAMDVIAVELYVESTANGVSSPVAPATLIAGLDVEVLSTSDTYTGVLNPGYVRVDFASPAVQIGVGGNETFRVSLTVSSDLSAAAVENLRLRIRDVHAENNSSGSVLTPVNASLQSILIDGNYIRSDITQLRDDQGEAAYNYPNPFNPRNQTTTIVYHSPSAGSTTIKIFTLTGRLVRSISHAAAAGSNEVTWDGKNGRGQTVRNGVYVAVIMPPGGTKQMVKIAVVK
jgi:hypothetical protein